MDLAALRTLIGYLTNDPNAERYTSAVIDTELDNTQDKWNLQAKILKDTVNVTLTADDATYPISGLTGTPIAFTRATHRGLPVEKKDKSYFDMYANDDWSDDEGTPRYFYVDATDPDLLQVVVYPIPQSSDIDVPLVLEYIKRHTAMSATTDTPFNSNTLLTPYHWGMAYDVSARLLTRDPSEINVPKSVAYQRIADGVLAEVVQTFKNLEREEPLRLRGGRSW